MCLHHFESLLSSVLFDNSNWYYCSCHLSTELYSGTRRFQTKSSPLIEKNAKVSMLTIYFIHPCQYFHLLVNEIPPNKTKTTLDIWPQCCGHLDRAWDKRRPALKNVFLALQTLLFWLKNYIKSLLTASVVSKDNPCYVAKHVTSYKVILYMTDSRSNHCVNRLFLFFSGSVWTFPREHCFL